MNTLQKIVKLSAAAVLALAFALPASAAGGRTPAPPSPSPNAHPSPAPVPGERHPKIREAIEALRAAKGDLEHAAHDFGGHRVEAIRSIDEAMRQLETCLKYDKD